MASHRRSRRIANAPYFLTVTLRNRRARHLTDHVGDLRTTFRDARARAPFHIEALVILPDHFHLLCSLLDGDADFSTRIRLIKRGFTIRLRDAGIPLYRNARGEYDLWQRRFWEHPIRDEADFERHVDYIHYNPVKHVLVTRIRDWPYSSIHRDVRRGLLPVDWGGAEPVPPESGIGELP
ncbi:REP-associated tyrosine transposase [Solimonas marina]|uniref:Transposase n=1 Tax=Solimonas marina TaxID=2714601 RepID=A0A969WBI6_9GAMM|nr:transposase [Solimonas marina]NKF23922.1 transposase [Solimonas marina]